MSTRATYRIQEHFPCPGTGCDTIRVKTFYIHYDSYPEGAAIYFKQFLQFKEELSKRCDIRKKLNQSIFELAIGNAEGTIDHDFHGDTEYQYDISFFKDQSCVVEMKGKYNDKSFVGSIEDFIEKYETE